MKKHRCSNCQKVVKIKTIPEYHFDLVGLPNVWLLNVDGYQCSQCGEESVILPNYGQLMSTIIQTVVFKNGTFTSQEICFLKKVFNLTGKIIAKKLGTSEKTVSFWMTGKSRVSSAYGIKLRQFFSEELVRYLKEKEEKIKPVLNQAKLYQKEAKKSYHEAELLNRLREKAKVSAKQKIKEAQFFASSDKNEDFLKVPNSKVAIALRN